jgi:hypothetical protein
MRPHTPIWVWVRVQKFNDPPEMSRYAGLDEGVLTETRIFQLDEM